MYPEEYIITYGIRYIFSLFDCIIIISIVNTHSNIPAIFCIKYYVHYYYYAKVYFV